MREPVSSPRAPSKPVMQTPTTDPTLPCCNNPETTLPPRFDTLFSYFLSFRTDEGGQPFYFFFYAVNGFHMASSESCREVIRQHSITGGRSICLFRPRNSSLLAFCELSQEVSMRRMARYHHLARLPAWLTMCLNKEYEKTLMPCGQIYLFAAFLFNMCFSLCNYVQE